MVQISNVNNSDVDVLHTIVSFKLNQRQSHRTAEGSSWQCIWVDRVLPWLTSACIGHSLRQNRTTDLQTLYKVSGFECSNVCVLYVVYLENRAFNVYNNNNNNIGMLCVLRTSMYHQRVTVADYYSLGRSNLAELSRFAKGGYTIRLRAYARQTFYSDSKYVPQVGCTMRKTGDKLYIYDWLLLTVTHAYNTYKRRLPIQLINNYCLLLIC